MEGGWKEKVYGEEEEEKKAGVFEETPGQNFNWGCYTYGRHWEFPGCMGQM